MRRAMCALLIVVLTAANLACGSRKPPAAAPLLPPPPSLPQPLLARPLDGVAMMWPPELEPEPVAEFQREAEPPAPARPSVPPGRIPEIAPPPPAVDPPRLTMPETPDATSATRQVRDLLERARRALAALRYERLAPDARAQYDTVVQLMQQAEDALRARDFAFALKVADKAETLARRLSDQV